jgi:uncharacterized membrane protein YcaP (DUF421 family)
MFFDTWADLGRLLVVSILAYTILILWLRISGKRTLSKWNAFDFVVTIALGSTLATVVMSKDVALVEGALAFALLIGFQFGITWLSVRSSAVHNLIKAQPTLLLDRGRFIPAAMQAQRVTESEVRAAVRAVGIGALEDVDAVVLETDGSFSVIKQAQQTSRSALADVADLTASAT